MKQTKVFKFALGEIVRDKISGFEGVVMSQCNYISGCTQYGVLARKIAFEGKSNDWLYLDENRLTFLGERIILDEGEQEETKKVETPIGGEDVAVSHDSNYPRIQ